MRDKALWRRGGEFGFPGLSATFVVGFGRLGGRGLGVGAAGEPPAGPQPAAEPGAGGKLEAGDVTSFAFPAPI